MISGGVASWFDIEEGGPARLRLFAATMLSALVFWIDAFTAMTSAVAVLYVVAMFVGGDALRRRGIVWVAAACCALTIVSFLLNHGIHSDRPALLRCLISLAAIAVAAALLLANRAAHVLQRTQAELLEVTQDAVVLRRIDGGVVLWNKGAERLYGWSRSEMADRDHHSVLSSRFSEETAAIVERLRVSGGWEGEIEQCRRDGEHLAVASRWRLRHGRGGRPDMVLETNTDMTERLRAIQALTESEWRYRSIFESLGVAIIEHDVTELRECIDQLRSDGVHDLRAHLRANPAFLARARSMVRITNVNDAALRMVGVESKEAFFPTLAEFLPENDESFPRFLDTLAGGDRAFEAEGRVRTASGGVLDIIVVVDLPRARGGFGRVPGCIFDITERNRMASDLERARRELDRAMRMATIGQVSATIAHEVNQPLSAIRTYADAARRWLSHDPPEMGEVSAALDDVVATSNHAGEVVKRIRRLLAGTDRESVPLLVDGMALDAMQLIGREALASGTEVTLHLHADGALVSGDPVLLQQVILNLATNAMAAMHDVPSGERQLEIRTGVEGRHAEIRVRDTGPGFAREISAHVFDAFFTTRTEGLGLGLAMCRSTIFAHGGSIEIEDTAQPGAQVLVRLPLL